MSVNLWLGVASTKALSTAWQYFQPGASLSVPIAVAVPSRCRLSGVVVYLDTIAGGATTVQLEISHDIAGREGVTPFATSSATQTISDLGGGYGYASWNLDEFPWIAESTETPVVRLKLNAGTAYGVVRLLSAT